MTLIDHRTALGSTAVVLGGLMLATYGFISRASLLVVLATSILATVALLGERASLVLWPLGLAANLLLAYAMYLWSWATSADGISLQEAQTFFVLSAVCFGVAAVVRVVGNAKRRGMTSCSKTASPIASIVLVAVPVSLVVLVMIRTGTSPERIISGHLGGGDHGAHNELINRLIDPSRGSELTSPLSAYSYPRAVHYLVGLINVFDGSVRNLPTVASTYVSAAQFEYLQLAAMVQSSLLIISGRTSSLQRSICAVSAVVFVMSIDNYVAHAFWSGFTTSLSITWLLLLAVAACKLELLPRHWLARSVVWAALALACWVTYQPFVVVGGVLFVGEVGQEIARRITARRANTFVRTKSLTIFFPLALPVFFSFVPWIVEGRTSPAVSSLLLDGSLHRPHFWTVVLLTITSVGGLLVLRQPQYNYQLRILLSVTGLALGSILVVMAAGGPGPMEQPYYVQKIFWILVYLGVPLTLGMFLDAVMTLLKTERWDRFSIFVALVAAAVLVPVANGRTPAAATRHASVDWFARAMVNEHEVDLGRAVAFYPLDPLGSHLANLALKIQSSTQMPIGTSLSGNPYLACRYINREPVDAVFTGPHGLSILAEAGCRLDRKYVIDGQQVDPPEPPFTDINRDVEYRVGSADIGQFLLFRGVRGVKQWGAELTGLLSAVGIKVPQGTVNPAVELKFRPSGNGPSEPEVTFGVGGRAVSSAPLHGFHWRTVLIPLLGSEPGEKLELTVDCAWSDEEVGSLSDGKKPESCVDLQSIRVVSIP